MSAATNVLQSVASMIGKDWKHLAGCLKLKVPLICIYRNNEKNMMKCFSERNLSWHETRNGLKNIQRSDIIQNICEKYNLKDGNTIFFSLVGS